MASKVTVPFEIQAIIKNLGEAQAQINTLHLPDDLGKKFLSYFTKALAEADKISKIEGKATKTKADQKASITALESLRNMAARLFGEMENLDKLQVTDLLGPAELKKFEDLVDKVNELKKQLHSAQSISSKEVFKNDPALLNDLKTSLSLTDRQISQAGTLEKVLNKQAEAMKKKLAAAELYDKLAGSHGNNGTAATANTLYENFKSSTVFTKRAGENVLNPGQREALVQSLVASVPDVAALMSQTLKKNGSLGAFDKFFQVNLVSIMEKARASMVGYSTDIAAKMQSALATLRGAIASAGGDVTKTKAAMDVYQAEIDETIRKNLELAQATKKASQSAVKGAGDMAGSGLQQQIDLDAEAAAKAEVERTTSNLQSKIKQLLGFGAVLHQVSRMVRHAISQIKELDAAMTQISVVTNFTNAQLWSQIDSYMALAQQYGVTTTGVYQVSQLYYQQGLNTAEVLKMTTETLKMAKIANLDYAAATDYMTVAIRGFKLDVDDAGRVVDVYSKLAAIAATDTRELAIAMSKTSSIAESAGMSIESTSTFLTQMIEVTREAPENLGTAMKTIIARFQEMKKSPLELVEVEGEQISLNKVDKALQTVGISLTDASGQFRNLDDVIFELSAKWDSLDRNTQRYIATTVAGSRQQSRFLALMSDNERLTQLYTESLDSEDAALLQYAKTLDSVESKLNQLSTSFQQFYMSIGNGPAISGVIDLFKGLLDIFNDIPKAIAFPGVIAAIMGLNSGLKGVVGQYKKLMDSAAVGTSSMATGFNLVKAAGVGAGAAIRVAFNWIALIAGVILAISTVIQLLTKTAAELQQELEDAKIKAAQTKKEYKDLVQLEKDWQDAKNKKDNSVEDRQKWLDINSKLADLYPQLIIEITKEGDAIVDLTKDYEALAESKQKAASNSAFDVLQKTMESSSKQISGIADENRNNVDELQNTLNSRRAIYSELLNNAIEIEEDGRKGLGRKTAILEDEYKKLEKNRPFGTQLVAENNNEGNFTAKYYKIEWLDSVSETVEDAADNLRTAKLAIINNEKAFVNYLENYAGALSGIPEMLPDTLADNKSFLNKAGVSGYRFIKKTLGEGLTEQQFMDFVAADANETKINNTIDRYYNDLAAELENADKVVIDTLNKKQDDLSLVEINSALSLITDPNSQVTTILKNIQESANTAYDYLENQLLGAGYGAAGSNGEQFLSEKLINNLKSMSGDIANKIVIQAIAIVKAQGEDSIASLQWRQAMTNVTDPEIRKLMANAEDPTSWFGAQGLANAAVAIDTSAGKKESQYLVDGANSIPIAIADIAAAMDEYVNGIEAGTKAWKKAGEFSLNEILSLIESGKFQASDFEDLKYKGSEEQFLGKYLPERYNQLKAKAGEGGENLTPEEKIQYNAWVPIVDAFFTQLRQDATKAIFDSIKSVFEKPEDVIKSIKNNKIYNKSIADAIGMISGQAVTGSDTEGYEIGDGGDIFQKAAGAFKQFGVNLYQYNKYVKDSYDGLQDIADLNKQIDDAKIKSADNELELQAKLAQYYSAINKIIMDPKTYDFMGSTYKDDLAPMYTLFENQGKALEVLKEAGKKGEIGNQDLRKMLSWTKDTLDKNIYEELLKQSATLDDDLTMSIEDSQMKAIEDALKKSKTEAIRVYNEEVEQLNGFINSLDDNQKFTRKDINGKEVVGVQYLGQTYKTIGELSKILEQTADPEKVQQALAIAADLQRETGIDASEAIRQGLEAVGILDDPLKNIEKNVADIVLILQKKEKEAEEKKARAVAIAKTEAEEEAARIAASKATSAATLKDQATSGQTGTNEQEQILTEDKDAGGTATKTSSGLRELFSKVGQIAKNLVTGLFLPSGGGTPPTSGPPPVTVQLLYEGMSPETAIAIKDFLEIYNTIVSNGAKFLILDIRETDTTTTVIEKINNFITRLQEYESNPLTLGIELDSTKIATSDEAAKALEAAIQRIREADARATAEAANLHQLQVKAAEDAAEIAKKVQVAEMAKTEAEESAARAKAEAETASAIAAANVSNAKIIDPTSDPFGSADKLGNFFATTLAALVVGGGFVEKILALLPTGAALASGANPSFMMGGLPGVNIDFSSKEGREQKDAILKYYNDLKAKIIIDPSLDPDGKIMAFIDELNKQNTSLNVGAEIETAATEVARLKKEVSKPVDLNINLNYQTMNTTIPGGGAGGDKVDQVMATGGVAQGGKTLVGELGPEMRVSNGQYSIVGNKGAEFVNLKRNDIIFNHLQTAGILNNKRGIRGKALVAGTGPAMESTGSSAGGFIKNLLTNVGNGLNKIITKASTAFKDGTAFAFATKTPIKDGTDTKDKKDSGGTKKDDAEAYTLELEKWFNWLRRIEQIENRLSILRANRELITNGTEYAKSLAEENAYLEGQKTILLDLIDKQTDARDILRTTMTTDGNESFFSFYGDALVINQPAIDAAIAAAGKGGQKLGETLQKLVTDYGDVNSAINENTVTIANNTKTQKDNLRILRDKAISVEEEVLSALQNMYQKEIDGKQEAIDAKVKANEKYISALRKSLEDERKLYEDNDAAQEKSTLQRRLSLLQRDTSGRNSTEIASLQEELKTLNREEYFTKREDNIGTEEESRGNETTALQNEVDLLATANQMKMENMQLYWDEVNTIISQGTEATLGFLTSWSQSYAEMSKTQQVDYLAEWSSTVAAAAEYSKELNIINESLTKPATDQAATVSTPPPTPASTPIPASTPTPTVATTPTSYVGKSYSSITKLTYSATSTVSQADADAKAKAKRKAAEAKLNKTPTTTRGTNQDTSGRISGMTYAKGGFVPYTGIAKVDGTPGKPESFFDAKATAAMIEFTKVLKQQMSPRVVGAPMIASKESSVPGDMTVNIEVKSGVVNNTAQANSLADEIFDRFVRLANKSTSIKVFRT